MKKEYIIPEVEIIELELEGVIATSGGEFPVIDHLTDLD